VLSLALRKEGVAALEDKSGLRYRWRMVGHAGVLIVEDDIDLRDCLREELELAGHRVLPAGNGREGLELLESAGRPCLVLLDLMMPIMNGFQFLAALRDRELDIPVVVTSAHLDMAGVPDGASEILAKPFSAAALLAVINRYC
jgi:CheY-like chemotaxis protein